MHATYRRSYDEESAVGGLIIINASYGAFPSEVDPFLPLHEQAYGPTIDVSVPLQCMINASQLICNGIIHFSLSVCLDHFRLSCI